MDRKHFPLVDIVKAVAAQLIVLHHLAWYGPMSDAAATLSPLFDLGQDWLSEYARYAVAAFLAIGGYLSAQSLKPTHLQAGKSPIVLIAQRYWRLVAPFAVALLLAVLATALARKLMVHESIGHKPSLRQFTAHLFLLQGFLGYESLSAGVWYVAIDFQLYALLVGLLWVAGRIGRRSASADFWAMLLVLGFAFSSLFFFNRDTGWDVTALYFFGAYGLGVLCGWAVHSHTPYRLLLLVAVIGGIALWIDFRPRIAVAWVVSLGLALGHLHLPVTSVPRLLACLSRSSYALFLVHFPVCLVVNAVVHRLAPDQAALNLLGIGFAWLASNAAAILFHRVVEARIVGFRWPPQLLRRQRG